MKQVQIRAMAIVALLVANPGHGATPTLEEIWRLVQQQQAQIEKLQGELRASQRQAGEAQSELDAKSTRQETRIAQTETALEAAASTIESMSFSGNASDTTIGGYGELHYNNLDNGNQIDLHRFVMFFSHQFDDEFSFYSELEVEHDVAGDGKPGEVEVEQAFVQWDYADSHRARMGVFLVPVGILNETHEPDTFFGTERNAVEKNIVPATWWEAGVSLDGEIAPGWSYDLAVHSGLQLDTGNASASKRSNIRSGRQKVAKANADSLAYTGRLRFSGIPGVQWNLALQYQSDLTQGDSAGIGSSGIDATLVETSLNYRRNGVGLRALYARWDIDDSIELLNAGADEQQGWYLEPSYRFESGLGIFARYGRYDQTAGSRASSEKSQFDIGLNYWLYDSVVLKADYQRQNNDSGSDVDGFSLGVGYSF